MAYRQDGYGSLMAKSRGAYINPVQRFQISKNFFGQKLGFSPQEMEFVYNDDALARRICDIPAHDAVRAGWCLKTEDETWNEDKEHDLKSEFDRLKVDERIAEAMAMADATGGAIIHMVCDDLASSEEEPLNLNNIRKIRKLEVYDRTRIFFNMDYLTADVRDENYGQLEFVNITNVYGNQFLCHTSRVIFLTGLNVTKRARSQMGEFVWGGSKIHLTQDEIANLRSAWSYALMDLGKQAQSVLKMGGLAAKLMLGCAGEEAVMRRLNMIDAGRSQMNTILLDKDTDDFEQYNMTLTGVKDIIGEHAAAFAAVAGIPAPILFGRDYGSSSLSTPGADNSVELETYYNSIEHKQKSEAKPILFRLIEVAKVCSEYGLALPEKFHIKFKPLFQKTDEDKAKERGLFTKAMSDFANACKVLVDINALDAEEIRCQLNEQFDLCIDEGKVIEPPEPIVDPNPPPGGVDENGLPIPPKGVKPNDDNKPNKA